MVIIYILVFQANDIFIFEIYRLFLISYRVLVKSNYTKSEYESKSIMRKTRLLVRNRLLFMTISLTTTEIVSIFYLAFWYNAIFISKWICLNNFIILVIWKITKFTHYVPPTSKREKKLISGRHDLNFINSTIS